MSIKRNEQRANETVKCGCQSGRHVNSRLGEHNVQGESTHHRQKRFFFHLIAPHIVDSTRLLLSVDIMNAAVGKPLSGLRLPARTLPKHFLPLYLHQHIFLMPASKYTHYQPGYLSVSPSVFQHLIFAPVLNVREFISLKVPQKCA